MRSGRPLRRWPPNTARLCATSPSDNPQIRYLGYRDVEYIHFSLVKVYFIGYGAGTRFGILKPDMLELAVNRPRSGTVDLEFYPTLELKAACLAESIAHNHPFVDANKRTGILSATIMMQLNGRSPVADPADLVELAVGLETGQIDIDAAAAWLDDWDHFLPVTEDELASPALDNDQIAEWLRERDI